MDKVLLTGVDGNFGGRAAKVAMEKLPKERLRKLLDAPVANRAVVGRAVN